MPKRPTEPQPAIAPFDHPASRLQAPDHGMATDHALLDTHDVHKLTTAVSELTKTIKRADEEQRRKLANLAERDVFDQILAELKGMRGDLQKLHAAFTARIGNGHDHYEGDRP